MNPIYLNNAATSFPKAPTVAGAVRRSLEELPGESGRGGKGADPAEECRSEVASLLGVADPRRIVLTANATHALNLAIRGLGLAGGALVVTTVTEHNSVLRPLRHLEAAGRIRVRLAGVAPDGGIDEAEFEVALREGPRLVALNHVSNVTGRIQDAVRLLGLARRAGATTLLDASQSIGHLELAAAAMPADLIAFTGHKGLLGPTGTGGLYVSPGLELDPLLTGGTGIRSDLEFQPPEMPLRLEAGTPNTAGLAGLAAAAGWLREHGDEHRGRENRTGKRLREGLGGLRGVRVFGPRKADPAAGIVSFQVRGWSVEDAGYALEESFGVVCRSGLHCAPLMHQAIGSAPEGTLRLSVSGFTTDEEVDAAVSAVARLGQCAS